MLSNYKRLSPEVAIASRSPAFAPGGPLSPLSPISPISSVFDRCVVSGVDGRTHGGLVRRSMEVPRDGNSGNDNAVVSSEANNGVDGVDPEANSPDSGGVEKSSAKPPRPGLQPILPCNAAARYASSTDFDLQFDKMSMITSPIGTSDEFLPIYRSGSWAERGPKSYMEDEHICIDNLVVHFNAPPTFPAPSSYYGVFDGHGGTDAAGFAKSSLLKFITGDKYFPHNMDKAIKNAFLKADHILADSDSLDQNSGTTVLTAFCFGRTLRIANAGDCRAVLGKRGRAVELSKDHKPTCKSEKARIEKLGGTIFDGYLNGQLAVSRALGDWHVKGSKTSLSPLSGEPELHELTLTAEDEFLIMGCDGLWDVMSSQCAVTMVRKELMAHNDPERCSKVLVTEALNRNSCDNLTVLVICFSPDPPSKIEVPRWRVRKSISMEGLHQIKGAMDASG